MRQIVVLARCLNYSRAAEELGISQPALSRAIQAFEARVGAKIFDRDRGGVHLTRLGQTLVGRAIALLEDAADIDRLLHSLTRAEIGEIAFGMAPLPARVLLHDALAEGLVAWPSLRSQVTIRGPRELITMVAAGEIEFGLGSQPMMEIPANVKGVTLGSFPLSLLVRAGHPLLAGPPDCDHADYPLVVSGAIGEPDVLPIHLHRHLTRRPHIVLDDFDALARITARSDAVWLSSTFAAREEIERGLLAELPQSARRELGEFKLILYSRERRSLSPAAVLLQQRFQQAIAAFRPPGLRATSPAGANSG